MSGTSNKWGGGGYFVGPTGCRGGGGGVPSKQKTILYNIFTMLDQRVDVVQMLYRCFVFAGWANFRERMFGVILIKYE